MYVEMISKFKFVIRNTLIITLIDLLVQTYPEVGVELDRLSSLHSAVKASALV